MWWYLWTTRTSKVTTILWDCYNNISRIGQDFINPWTARNAWMHIQHCGYWYCGVGAAVHQYPYAGLIFIVFDRTVTRNRITIWQKNDTIVLGSIFWLTGMTGALVLYCRNSPITFMTFSGKYSINILRPKQNGRHFTDDIFKCIFLNENDWISIKISLKFVPKDAINNIPALVQIMAWRRSGDKPISEHMMVSLLTHICVTRPQWVKNKQ